MKLTNEIIVKSLVVLCIATLVIVAIIMIPQFNEMQKDENLKTSIKNEQKEYINGTLNKVAFIQPYIEGYSKYVIAVVDGIQYLFVHESFGKLAQHEEHMVTILCYKDKFEKLRRLEPINPDAPMGYVRLLPLIKVTIGDEEQYL